MSLKRVGRCVLLLPMPTMVGPYDAAIRALRRVSRPLGRGSGTVSLGIRGREGAGAALADWGRDNRTPGRPLSWFHAPSVGEGLQAKAVIESLREHLPNLQVAYTHFSPSAAAFSQKLSADVASYLPWDVRAELREVMDRLDPDLIAFTKTEVWPGVTGAAVERGTPVVLIAATLPSDARRMRWPARHLLRPTFGSLARVLAISVDDGERFLDLGVPQERIEVTGDPGVDSAWIRARGADPSDSLLAPFLKDGRTTVVAGSTWGPDDDVVIPTIATLRERFRDLRVILAPHEPNASTLDVVERKLAAAGLRHGRLAEVSGRGEPGDMDAVVVDRVGVLAHLYTVADAAFVGGGFGRDGLHSVLEPAAAGVPVLFGPRHGNSRAAAELVRVGGGSVVRDGAAMVKALDDWLKDPQLLEEAGRCASAYIEGHRGASERTARALVGFLSPASGAAR